MDFISISDALKQGSGSVSIHGWVYRERKSKSLAFIIIRDGTSIVQCVIEKDKVSEQLWSDAERLSIESSVEIRGVITKDDRAPTGYDVAVTHLKVLQFAERFPITKDQSTEFLLDQRHLWLRSRKLSSVMKIRATILEAFREYYRGKGFIEYSPPILQPTQCEGGSTLFPVRYYDREMYLAQTAQLYSEAMTFALGKVFCIAPTFRAEKSKTARHLSEFWMAEMEASWMDLKGLQDDVEQLLCHIVKRVLENHEEDLKVLERDIEPLKKVIAPFPRLKYAEALKLLKEKAGMNVPFGKDLRTIEEDKLSEMFDKPIIISHYPKEIMAFYKPSDPEDKKTALCIDVIAPEKYGEIIGGSQRDTAIEAMKKELEKMGEDSIQYEWYFDLRRFGNVVHSGHGMGVGRVVAWICGLETIRDSIPFPRTMKRFSP